MIILYMQDHYGVVLMLISTSEMPYGGLLSVFVFCLRCQTSRIFIFSRLYNQKLSSTASPNHSNWLCTILHPFTPVIIIDSRFGLPGL